MNVIVRSVYSVCVHILCLLRLSINVSKILTELLCFYLSTLYSFLLNYCVRNAYNYNLARLHQALKSVVNVNIVCGINIQ